MTITLHLGQALAVGATVTVGNTILQSRSLKSSIENGAVTASGVLVNDVVMGVLPKTSNPFILASEEYADILGSAAFSAVIAQYQSRDRIMSKNTLMQFFYQLGYIAVGTQLEKPLEGILPVNFKSVVVI